MRNLLVPLLIIAAVALFLVANFNIITSGADSLDAFLQGAETAAASGDYAAAKERVDAFLSELKEARKYLDAVVSHNETDNIMLSAERLPSLCSEETAREFFAEIAVARALIRHVRDGELPTLENIL